MSLFSKGINMKANSSCAKIIPKNPKHRRQKDRRRIYSSTGRKTLVCSCRGCWCFQSLLLASLHFRQPWNDLSAATETYHQLCVKRITPTYVQDPESVTRSKRSLSSNWQFDRLIWKTQKQIVPTPDSPFESIKLFIVIMLYSISSFFPLFYKSNFTKKLTQLLEKKNREREVEREVRG